MPNFSLSDSIFEAAADKFATPFHLYDEAGLRQNARDLNAAFSWCKDFKEYFAVKASSMRRAAAWTAPRKPS